MGLMDTLGGVMGGAGTGAAIGSLFPGPGTAIGAIGGGLLGGIMGYEGGQSRDQANSRRRAAMDDAMQQLAQFSQMQNQQRAADLDKIMAFYGPAQQQLTKMYGGYSNQPPPPAQSAPLPVRARTTPPGMV